MSDSHTQEGQVQRAKRLRELIENLKSGTATETPENKPSLREQIEDRAKWLEEQKEKEAD